MLLILLSFLIQFWIVCDMTSVFTCQSASGRHLKISWLESGDHDNAQTAPVCSGTLSELSQQLHQCDVALA